DQHHRPVRLRFVDEYLGLAYLGLIATDQRRIGHVYSHRSAIGSTHAERVAADPTRLCGDVDVPVSGCGLPYLRQEGRTVRRTGVRQGGRQCEQGKSQGQRNFACSLEHAWFPSISGWAANGCCRRLNLAKPGRECLMETLRLREDS